VIDRVTVYEASERLGITEGAVRQRIHRGTLESERDDQGRVYVYLTPDDTQNNTEPHGPSYGVYNGVNDALLDELRDRIRFLEEQLDDRKDEAHRKDSIIMSLTQRVPELEAATEPRESPVAAPEPTSKGEEVPEESTEGKIKQPWWQRWFGSAGS
jgi:hypothetical protein